MNGSFVWGVVIGAAGFWAFHRWVKPVSSTKG